MEPGELEALVGHRFPGGTYRVAHWENWLLTDCTGRAPMAGDLVHPIVLFHAPILGAGTSIAELFALGQASGLSGSVGLLGYDWQYFQPLREDVTYEVTGGVVAAERVEADNGAIADRVAFQIDLADRGQPVARVTNRWQFRRTTHHAPAPGLRSVPPNRDPAAVVAPWEMTSVDPARMKTMAALLRDPYPVHWDREATATIGLGGRVINQGPLNLGYIANMAMAWAGDDAVRRLTVAFGRPVLDGDHVVAGGQITSVADNVAHCDVWLTRGEEVVVSGTAEVAQTSTMRS